MTVVNDYTRLHPKIICSVVFILLTTMDNIIDSDIFMEKEILTPHTHIFQNDGKNIRSKIVTAFNHWLKVPADQLQFIINTVNMTYEGSMILDDIQDNSTTRRGLPASFCVYGIPLTINAGVHVLTLALGRFFKIHPKAAEIYQRDMLEVCRGQGIEIYWRDNMICPTEEQYRRVLEQKTGRMFSMTVSIMQLVSEHQVDCFRLALLLGEYFQLRDDYCNLICQEELEEWPVQISQDMNAFCEDITEGKFTMPIIHAMGTPQADAIRNILRQRTTDVQLKKYCVSLIQKSGGLEYTRDILKKLDQEAREIISRLGGNPELEAVLDELLGWQ